MGWSVLGDDALVPERRWEPPPFRRGTFQIFFECFVTLLLCLWTALHLNISAEYKHHLEGRGKIAKLIPWKKCRYLLLGLIAPEVVSSQAFDLSGTAVTSSSFVRSDEYPDYRHIDIPVETKGDSLVQDSTHGTCFGPENQAKQQR